VAVHNPHLADDLRQQFPGTAVHAVPMGVADPLPGAGAANAIRARHAVGPGTVVLAAFGAVTAEKRIEPAIRALAVARRYTPDIRLLLVGQAMPHFDAGALANAEGVADLIVHAGYVNDAELPGYLAASDVVLSLRWPSGRETSASWLRAIAAGRPTIVTDLAQQWDLPALDPRTWTAWSAPGSPPRDPIAVAVDPLDEAHSLTLATKRLVADRALRDRLGAAARRYWLDGHTIEHMTRAYEGVLADAAGRADPVVELPPHLRPDPAAFARTLLADFPGVRLF
jgi:glycosyltransferase involved in cell wall biosynthesis